MKKFPFILIVIFVFVACNKTPEIDNATMLDGDQIFDMSIAHPENYLVSEKYLSPTEAQKNTPVIIAAHGFSASNFEWDELRAYANIKGTFLVSQVLLGAHGRTYNDFKKSTWNDWQASIKTEYSKLVNLGFRKIFLVGSSTGGPLILNLVKSGFFNTTSVKGIFLVDPIIVSSNKSLTLVSTLGPLMGFTTTELTNGEKGHWYVYRPYQSLKQLMKLIDLTRKDLQEGFNLPAGTICKLYKSKEDDVADPVSAFLIYKGLKTSTGGNIDVEMENSKLHVFTRLSGREGITPSDISLQQKVFADMELKMTQ